MYIITKTRQCIGMHCQKYVRTVDDRLRSVKTDSTRNYGRGTRYLLRIGRQPMPRQKTGAHSKYELMPSLWRLKEHERELSATENRPAMCGNCSHAVCETNWQTDKAKSRTEQTNERYRRSRASRLTHRCRL